MTALLPDQQFRVYMVGILAFNILPHAMFLPGWVMLCAALFLTYAFLHIGRGWPVPNKWLSAAVSFVGAVGVYVTFGTLTGHEPATALLVFLASLKLSESTRYRDIMLLIFTCYFLLMAHLLNSQTLSTLAFMIVDVIFITSLMFHLHKSDRRSSLRSFKPAARMFLMAVPMWIFLFFAFPRFSAGLWNFSGKNNAGTGFSDTLRPGDVSKLSQSDEVAFRVTFTPDLFLPSGDLYWRGAILTESEGLSWSRATIDPKVRFGTQPGYARTVQQHLTLEPMFQTWVFGLDVPLSVKTDVRGLRIQEFGGHTFRADDEISRKTLIVVNSALTPIKEILTPEARDTTLRVPDDLSPAVRGLAADLLTKAGGSNATTEARVEAALSFFANDGFAYTLQPGSMNGLDDFLFGTRAGFCEHYAATFGVIMRLMKVPARVVVGFQGAERNDVGGYFVVRARDAHAWNEIWNDAESRWQRVDPTASVAPLRVRMGGLYNTLDENEARKNKNSVDEFLTNGPLKRLFDRLENAWDALAYEWHSFLIRYDYAYQLDLLRKIGLVDPDQFLFLGGVVACVGLFAIFLRWWISFHARKDDPLVKTYAAFCQKLTRSGVHRRGNEGPRTLATRALRAFSHDAKAGVDVVEILDEYARLRYGPDRPSFSELRKLKGRVRSFRPPRMKRIPRPGQRRTRPPGVEGQ